MSWVDDAIADRAILVEGDREFFTWMRPYWSALVAALHRDLVEIKDKSGNLDARFDVGASKTNLILWVDASARLELHWNLPERVIEVKRDGCEDVIGTGRWQKDLAPEAYFGFTPLGLAEQLLRPIFFERLYFKPTHFKMNRAKTSRFKSTHLKSSHPQARRGTEQRERFNH